MPLKPLVETNPYLKDPEVRAQLLALAVSTSTSIETIHAIDPRAHIPVKADVLEKISSVRRITGLKILSIGS